MRTGVIAEKLGMTRLFADDGRHVPVTVLKVDGRQVVSVRTTDRDGYSAVQLGHGPDKPENATDTILRPLPTAGVPAKPTCRENCMGRLENGLALGGVTVGMWGLNSAATHCVFIRVSSTGEPFHGVRIGMGSATNIASCIAVMDLNTCRNRRFQHVFQMLGSYDG